MSGKRSIKLRNNASRHRPRRHSYSSKYSLDNVRTSRGTRLETQKDRVTKNQKLQRKRISLLVAGALAVALLVSSLVGYIAFVNSLNARMSAGISQELDILLSPVGEDGVSYTLLVGMDEGDDGVGNRADAVLMMRVDPNESRITLVSVPRDLMLPTGGTHYQKVSSLYAEGGGRALIKALGDFTGVDFNHYVETNYAGFMNLIDVMGGVEMDVPVRIEDQRAGQLIVDPGSQVLDGAHALVFVRSKDVFREGDVARTENQRMLLVALARQVSDMGRLRCLFKMDTVASSITTDMSVKELMGFVRVLRGIDFETSFISSAIQPSSSEVQDGVTYLYIKSAQISEMMTRFKAGESPIEELPPARDSIDPADYTVTVRNGAGIAGIADD
ncbi:MAG: LCP family protein, partial [Coriobacteriales bacterium]|nr:LCP family protein [Coriobacteriales bacterium]